MVRQDSRRSCWTSPEELFLDWQQFGCPIPPSFGGVGLLVESIKNPKSPPGQTPPEWGTQRLLPTLCRNNQMKCSQSAREKVFSR